MGPLFCILHILTFLIGAMSLLTALALLLYPDPLIKIGKVIDRSHNIKALKTECKDVQMMPVDLILYYLCRKVYLDDIIIANRKMMGVFFLVISIVILGGQLVR